MLDINDSGQIRARIDIQLKELLSDPNFSRYYDVISQFVLTGGKRLRPLLCVYTYKATGGRDFDEIIKAAAAIELVHAHSLILDDIMDEDEFRRGRKTVYKQLKDEYPLLKSDATIGIQENNSPSFSRGAVFKDRSAWYGVSYAIMLANITAIIARKAILSCHFPDTKKILVLKMLEESDRNVYHGQMMDLDMEERTSSEKEYLEMISLKTGELFRMAAGIGCIFSDADEKTMMALQDFAANAAIGFQIKDDILDISSGKGHSIGSDIDKGKNSLVILKLKETMDIAGKTTQEIIDSMNTYGAIDYCENMAKKFISASKTVLAASAIGHEDKLLLEAFSELMIARTH